MNAIFTVVKHCVKSVCIWSYSGPHFPVRTEYGEIRTQDKDMRMIFFFYAKHLQVFIKTKKLKSPGMDIF